MKERKRRVVMAQLRSVKLKLAQAAEVMEVSNRQAKRVWRRYREQGDAVWYTEHGDDPAGGA